MARWMAPDTVMTTKTLAEVTEHLGGKITVKDYGLFSEFLNAAGEQGWELIQCQKEEPDSQSGESYYFKRPKR